MITVGELKELLKDMKDDTVIVIGDEIPVGIYGPIKGKVREGWKSHHFRPNEKGTKYAIYFQTWTEFSDGRTALANM
jgi:hypothetical protein